MKRSMLITKSEIDQLLLEMRRQSEETSAIRESLHEMISSFKEMKFHVNQLDIPNF